MQDQNILSQPAGGGADEDFTTQADKSFFSSLNLLTLALILSMAIYWGWPTGMRLTMLALFGAIVIAAIFSRYAAILCRCILPLLIGAICVEAYIALNEQDFAPHIVKYFNFDQKYTESFYSGVATLYAIITALALVKGIEDFDAIKRNIADEVYKVRTISELTHYFDFTSDAAMRETVLSLRRKLMRYAANVASLRDQTTKGENLELLRSLRTDVAQLRPADENDQHSLQLIVEAHSELGVLRSKRIGSIGEKIPHYLIAALWLMAAGLILPFMAEPLLVAAQPPATGLIPNAARFGQYYIIFLMGTLNSFLLLMLSDISDPFDGFWTVKLDAFHELYAALKDEMTDGPQRPA